MAGLLYDAGMLVALDRGAKHAWGLHEQSNADLRLAVPVVPVMVLAQVWRGGPQHRLSRALKGCRLFDATEKLARAAGALCGRAATVDVVDASVVVLAAELGAVVVTSDLDDLSHLVDALGVHVALHRV